MIVDDGKTFCRVHIVCYVVFERVSMAIFLEVMLVPGTSNRVHRYIICAVMAYPINH